MRSETLLTIVAMALVTYATRAGGLWLMARVASSPRVETWLRYVPGSVLIALVAPAALSGGPSDVLAALIAASIMARTRNMLLTIAVGVGAAWVLRQWL